MGQKLSQRLKALAEKYALHLKESLGDELVSVVLFGSVARGEATPLSDIDILVILEAPPVRRVARLEKLEKARKKLEMELEELWNSEIYADFVEVIKSRKEAEKVNLFYLDMIEDALILYDKGKFFEGVLEGLRKKLSLLGARRLKQGKTRYWELKPDLRADEVFEL